MTPVFAYLMGILSGATLALFGCYVRQMWREQMEQNQEPHRELMREMERIERTYPPRPQ